MQDRPRQYSRFPDNYDPESVSYIDEEMRRAAEQARSLDRTNEDVIAP